jgi:hypothetical protein
MEQPPRLKSRVVVRSDDGRRVFYPGLDAVAEQLAAIPRGAIVSVSALRTRLALAAGVEECSVDATGRRLVELAGLVAADLRRGRCARWPIWRVTNDNGQLPGNWPLAARWRAAMLREEGQELRFLRSAWSVA